MRWWLIYERCLFSGCSFSSQIWKQAWFHCEFARECDFNHRLTRVSFVPRVEINKYSKCVEEESVEKKNSIKYRDNKFQSQFLKLGLCLQNRVENFQVQASVCVWVWNSFRYFIINKFFMKIYFSHAMCTKYILAKLIFFFLPGNR